MASTRQLDQLSLESHGILTGQKEPRRNDTCITTVIEFDQDDFDAVTPVCSPAIRECPARPTKTHLSRRLEHINRVENPIHAARILTYN